MKNIIKKEKLLFSKETQFNNISVVRRGDVVTLWSGSNKQTEIIDRGDRDFTPNLEYSRSSFLSLGFHPDPRSILVLGLGGGAIPTLLHRILAEAVIDVVEIDSEIPAIAREYFYFSMSERLRLYVDDAFYFLRDAKKQYDIVIMDAYIGNQLPETVDSMAFIAEARRAMAPRGVFVANLMSANQSLFKAMLARIEKLFENIRLLPCIISTNTLVFASRKPVLKSEILERMHKLAPVFPFEIKYSRMVSRLESYTGSDQAL